MRGRDVFLLWLLVTMAVLALFVVGAALGVLTRAAQPEVVAPEVVVPTWPTPGWPAPMESVLVESAR